MKAHDITHSGPEHLGSHAFRRALCAADGVALLAAADRNPRVGYEALQSLKPLLVTREAELAPSTACLDRFVSVAPFASSANAFRGFLERVRDWTKNDADALATSRRRRRRIFFRPATEKMLDVSARVDGVASPLFVIADAGDAGTSRRARARAARRAASGASSATSRRRRGWRRATASRPSRRPRPAATTAAGRRAAARRACRCSRGRGAKLTDDYGRAARSLPSSHGAESVLLSLLASSLAPLGAVASARKRVRFARFLFSRGRVSRLTTGGGG